ncbi:hypothetical protein J6590_090326 [Homalodisca vitripennis]|nr:hypothetical protein J6590_090326 [Homalodisca vitripennis]
MHYFVTLFGNGLLSNQLRSVKPFKETTGRQAFKAIARCLSFARSAESEVCIMFVNPHGLSIMAYYMSAVIVKISNKSKQNLTMFPHTLSNMLVEQLGTQRLVEHIRECVGSNPTCAMVLLGWMLGTTAPPNSNRAPVCWAVCGGTVERLDWLDLSFPSAVA